jgi:hypothetical protein
MVPVEVELVLVVQDQMALLVVQATAVAAEVTAPMDLVAALVEVSVVHLAVEPVVKEIVAVVSQPVVMELYVLFGDLVDHTLYTQMLHMNLQSIIL